MLIEIKHQHSYKYYAEIESRPEQRVHAKENILQVMHKKIKHEGIQTVRNEEAAS